MAPAPRTPALRGSRDTAMSTPRQSASAWQSAAFCAPPPTARTGVDGVTGPDEYTTVVNNNLFTNVMARYNLEQAVQWVEWTRRQEPDEFARIDRRPELGEIDSRGEVRRGGRKEVAAVKRRRQRRQHDLVGAEERHRLRIDALLGVGGLHQPRHDDLGEQASAQRERQFAAFAATIAEIISGTPSKMTVRSVMAFS